MKMNRPAGNISRVGLALDQAPPLSAPLRFMLTAPAFALLAGLVLVWLGPGAFTSRWAPPTIGLTHLLTLGFITMVAVGAILQMLPVLSGVAAPRPRWVAGVVHPLLALGTLGLSGGFLFEPLYLRLGGTLLGVGVATFVAVMAVTFARIHVRPGSAIAGMRLAIIGLAIAAALGVARGAAYAWGIEVSAALTGAHVAWALLGWAGLLIVAVAFQVVPMFQITPDYPPVIKRWLPGGLFLALVGWSVGVLAGSVPVEKAFEAILAAGFCSFAAVTLRLQARRRRRITDAFIWFWRLGMASIFAATAVRLAASWSGGSLHLDMLFGALVLVGAILSVMLGMLYKIIPFLIWLHSRSRPGGVHNMNQVLPERRARYQFRLHAAALGLLVLACIIPAISRVAGLLFAVSCAFLTFNLVQAAHTQARARA